MSDNENNEGQDSNEVTKSTMDYYPNPWAVLKATTLYKWDAKKTLKGEKQTAQEALTAAKNALSSDAIEWAFEEEKITVDEEHLDNLGQLQIKCNIISEEIEVLHMAKKPIQTKLLPDSQKRVAQEGAIINQNASTLTDVLDSLSTFKLRNIEADSNILDGLLTTRQALLDKSPDTSAVEEVRSTLSYIDGLIEDHRVRLGEATERYDDANDEYKGALETVRNQVVTERNDAQQTALGSFNDASGRLKEAMTTLSAERRDQVSDEVRDWLVVTGATISHPFQRASKVVVGALTGAWSGLKQAYHTTVNSTKDAYYADTNAQKTFDETLKRRAQVAASAGQNKPTDFS